MVKLKLAEPIAGVSIRAHIVSMEQGEEKPFSIKNDQTIRSAISSKIKVDFPDRKYRTKRETVDGERIVTVIREK